jgi:hypothetical protein
MKTLLLFFLLCEFCLGSYIQNNTPGGGGGGGINSINGDTTANQIISGSNNISASTSSGVTVINGALLLPKANPAWTGMMSTPLTASQFVKTDGSSNLTSGIIGGSDLPNPSASTLGGIESYVAVTHQWINTISTSGVPSSSQPAFSDISGSIANSQLPVPSQATWPGSVTTCTTSATIDFSTAPTIEVDLTASDTCVLTFSNLTVGAAYVLTVLNATSATITWPGSVDWGAAGAPTLSASGKYDDVHLLVRQSTSHIHAAIIQGFSN